MATKLTDHCPHPRDELEFAVDGVETPHTGLTPSDPGSFNRRSTTPHSSHRLAASSTSRQAGNRYPTGLVDVRQGSIERRVDDQDVVQAHNLKKAEFGKIHDERGRFIGNADGMSRTALFPARSTLIPAEPRKRSLERSTMSAAGSSATLTACHAVRRG
jgi:hypothetical protein